MYTLHLGNSLHLLATLPDSSIDSIVTDPPYELGFMGKSWDASGIAYNIQLWQEALRVLKPGGHLLAFSGSRTYHRMTCAIEDAGFEVRDQIMWVYGSGFPKSLDVSKAIDKAGAEKGVAIRAEIARLISESGKTDSEVAAVAGVTAALVRFWRRGERSIMAEEAEKLKSVLGNSIPKEAEREIVGVQKGAMSGWSMDGDTTFADRVITAPATPAAKQWQGWGTALKPAHEPICVARKPLTGTVAANVLAHGTGALNIDGCRVDGRERTEYGLPNATRTKGATYGEPSASADFDSSKGRWPANLIHDGSDEVVALFPDSSVTGKRSDKSKAAPVSGTAWLTDNHESTEYTDSGSAARFFYCAKTSKKDRNEGCEALPQKAGGMVSNTSGQHITRRDEGYTPPPQGNNHPTVKPTDLMRYLCRLVTPPGGTVLDPFMGSGSTGKAAILEGFRFTGIEMNEEYMAIAAARIEAAFETTIADMI